MSPELDLDRIVDSFAWIEYFRGTDAGRVVADEIEASAVGTPLVVVAELRDKYVREHLPDWSRDLAFIKEMTVLVPEDELIAVRAGETKNRMRTQGHKDFGLIDGIIYETAWEADAILVTGDPHFRGVRGVRFLD